MIINRIINVNGGKELNQSFGADDAVSTAIEKYADMVRRICFLYLKNSADVEDVFQDVFLKYFLNAGALQSEEHQKAWLCKVTFNKCKDLCKSSWRKKTVSIEEIDIPYESPEQSELIKAVLQLPPEHKQLIYLHYYEGLTIPEIAQSMNKNTNTIYSQLRRAKARLKQKVGEI